MIEYLRFWIAKSLAELLIVLAIIVLALIGFVLQELTSRRKR